MSWWYVAFNHQNKALGDPAVRNAIATALDRDELLQSNLGRGDVLTGPFAEASPFYDFDVEMREPDIQAARRMLDGAGYAKKGNVRQKGKVKLAFKFVLDKEMPEQQSLFLGMQAQLRKVGIGVEPVYLDHAAYKETVWKRKDYDLTLNVWSFEEVEDVQPLFHSKGALNFINHSNPEVDELLDTAQRSQDYKTFKKKMKALHGVVHKDLPYLFLWSLDVYSGVSKRVKNVLSPRIITSPHFPNGDLDGEANRRIRLSNFLYCRLFSPAIGRYAIIYMTVRLAPGNAVDAITLMGTPDEIKVQLAADFGLDKPPAGVCPRASHAVRGDLGDSLVVAMGSRVADEALPAYWVTLKLAGLSLLACLALCFLIALFTSSTHRRRFSFVEAPLYALTTTPSFIMAVFLIHGINSFIRLRVDPNIAATFDWYALGQPSDSFVPLMIGGAALIFSDGLFVDYLNSLRAELTARSARYSKYQIAGGVDLAPCVGESLLSPHRWLCSSPAVGAEQCRYHRKDIWDRGCRLSVNRSG